MSYQPKYPSAQRTGKGFQALSISKGAKIERDHQSDGIDLVANYFTINLANKNSIFSQHTITVTPEPSSRRLRRRAIYCWLKTHSPRVSYATNYHNLLITNTRIQDYEDQREFKFWDEHEIQARAQHAPSCRISIKFDKDINILRILEQLGSKSDLQPPDLEARKNDMLNIMNIIFSQRMNERSFRVPNQPLQVAAANSAKFFQLTTPTAQDLLGGGLDHSGALLVAQRGFLHSTQCPGRLLLNINNATGTFYRAGSLTDLIGNFIGGSNTWPRLDLSSFLKGLRVRTNHLMGSNGRPEKIYTISRVAVPRSPNQNQRPIPARIFFNLNGTNTSVGTYYAQGLVASLL
jgi:Argonaute linker 1 domain